MPCVYKYTSHVCVPRARVPSFTPAGEAADKNNECEIHTTNEPSGLDRFKVQSNTFCVYIYWIIYNRGEPDAYSKSGFRAPVVPLDALHINCFMIASWGTMP